MLLCLSPISKSCPPPPPPFPIYFFIFGRQIKLLVLFWSKFWDENKRKEVVARICKNFNVRFQLLPSGLGAQQIFFSSNSSRYRCCQPASQPALPIRPCCSGCIRVIMQPRETLKLSLASSKNVLGRKEEESLKSQILEQSTIDIQPFFCWQ